MVKIIIVQLICIHTHINIKHIHRVYLLGNLLMLPQWSKQNKVNYQNRLSFAKFTINRKISSFFIQLTVYTKDYIDCPAARNMGKISLSLFNLTTKTIPKCYRNYFRVFHVDTILLLLLNVYEIIWCREAVFGLDFLLSSFIHDMSELCNTFWKCWLEV